MMITAMTAGKNCTVEDDIFHMFQIAGAEIFGDRNAKAGTASHAEAEDQKLDTGAGTDAGKCLGSEALADNGSINDVIGLLEQVSYQKRKSELQHDLQGIALRHGI